MIKKESVHILKDGREIKVLDVIQDFKDEKQYALILYDNHQYIYEMTALKQSVAPKNNTTTNKSTDEKIALYRAYFRGNDEIVATSFRTKVGKMVYYPWCLIRKQAPCPKVKKPQFQCSKCTVHRFQKMTDDVIFNHLKGVNRYGKEVMYGLYPIVDQNQTFLLVFDFDKADWRQEVKVLAKVAQSLKLDYLIEISQSGNGAHVWLFFEDKILARKARALGDIMLTQAMKQYPELSFEAFDRIFPNQDDVSNGGFGNLIALPLQGKRVLNGFSRFVDDDLVLIDDIWSTLEQTTKISEEEVDGIINKYTHNLPSNYYKAEKKVQQDDLTLFEYASASSDKKIDVTLGSEITIPIKELTRDETVRLRFLASFYNKAYFKALNQRLNTRNIPKMISLSEVEAGEIKLPRGLYQNVLKLYPKANIIHQQVEGKTIHATFQAELYEAQQQAYDALTQHNDGLLCAGTGFGKTVIASKMIVEKGVSTLIIVHSKSLAAQWKSQIETFVDLEDDPFPEYTEKGRLKKKDKIGMIQGGKSKRSKNIDIALFQTLTTMDNLEDVFNDYGMVIVDEAHHVAAKTFEDVMAKVNSRYVYGLTATPKREDGLENIIYFRIGPIRHFAKKEVPHHIAQKLYLRFTASGEHLSNIQDQSIHDNHELIVADAQRNEVIVQDIVDCIKEKRHIIVLSRFINHIQALKRQFEKLNQETNVYILNSHMKTSQLKEEMTALKEEGKPFVLFTTGSYAGEGFDLPALDTLMLVMPIKAKGSIQQYLGRLLRNLNDKEELRVYDYVDYAIPMFYKMYMKRLRTYKTLGYILEENSGSELYQSNMIEGDYMSLLMKDLKAANWTVFMMAYLSKDMIHWLVSLDDLHSTDKIIVMSEKTERIMAKNLTPLYESGFQIQVVPKVSQNFIIIDNRLVWMLSSMREDDVKNQMSLRLFSESIAKKLVNKT
ncbi:DEAD/DEAH box helicase family protein [Staphylococcus pseudintermedius]|nr:DEAD/DEAH box helicase family protein [Staphylococcus pseudintermedius]